MSLQVSLLRCIGHSVDGFKQISSVDCSGIKGVNFQVSLHVVMLVIFPSTQMLSVLYLMPTCYVFKLWYISVDSATVSLLCCSNYLFHNYAVVPEWHNFWATSVKSSGTNIVL